MTRYMTMQGNIIELTDKEYYEFPKNSTLTKLPDEENKKEKTTKYKRRND